MSESMCPKCKGDGIIGAGERPWEKAGATGTCDMCGGTGNVEEGDVQAEQAVAPAEDKLNAPEEDKKPDEEVKETVDNEEVNFKDFNVIAEEGFTTPVFGHLAKGSVIKLNPLNDSVIAAVASGIIEEVAE